MELKNRRILVTGGTGFVGSHLVKALVHSGASVVVPFRSIDPKSYFRTESLEDKVVMAICDLKERGRIEDIITKYEIEFVYHLAAQPIVTTAYQNPVETIESNIMGTVHILEACRIHSGVKGLIVASSDKAYGKSDVAYTEDMPLRGDHPYEVSKSAADLICTSYAKTYGLPVVITRFGNIYGPGDLNFSRIIPGIMKSAKERSTLRLRSDGSHRREYVYVADVANAYLHISKNFQAYHGKAFNVGTGDRYSVLEVIRLVKQILRVNIRYSIINDAVNEITAQSLDSSAIRETGWKPNHSIEDGLKRSWKWYSHILGD